MFWGRGVGKFSRYSTLILEYLFNWWDREINECLGFLDIMSAQWETAKHCHSALSLLSTNIRQSSHTNHTPGTRIRIPHSHDSASRDEHTTNATRNKKRRLDPSTHPVDPAPVSTTTQSRDNNNLETKPQHQHQDPISPPTLAPEPETYQNPTLPDLHLDYDLTLYDNDYNHNLPTIPDISSNPPSIGVGVGVGNFDLNMVGLLQDGDDGVFDFELFGSRFPSF